MATTFTYPKTVSLTSAATTSGSPNLTVLASAAGSWAIVIGTLVEHANIPAGTTIIGFNTTTQVVMSQNATTTGSGLTVAATNPDNINIDAVPNLLKVGGEIYNINGVALTMDQDSRVGLNTNTSGTLGNITLSATLGGTLNIDGRYVRMIPYNSGTGNVPAWNTVISKGSASGKLIGVHSALTATSTATGAAMPASGYLRIKQWNSVAFTSGALTGISASATGADVVGWIEIVGDESSTITANRLNTVNITGEWFALGTTSGSSNQTIQTPNNGLLRYLAGVYIEKTQGQADYEFWPNAGTTTTTGTEAARGKCVWIDANGLVRIGNSGAATNGYTPAANLAVVIPNILFENCTTAARTANVIPNSSAVSRYDFTTTGGGVVNADKCNFAWYPSFAQAYSVQLTNCCAIDAILLSECATAITWSKVGVGNKPTTALLTSALTISLCFAGGTLTDCVWQRVSLASAGAYINTLTDIAGFTFIRDTTRTGTNLGNAGTATVAATRCNNCTWTDPECLGGKMLFTTCNGISVTNEKYAQVISGTSGTTVTYAWELSSNTLNATFDGLTFPITNTHPYSGILSLLAAGCANIKLRNIGTRSSPLSCGSSIIMGLVYVLAAGAAASDIKVQRVYVSSTRTGIMTGDNSSTRVTEENVWGDYADAAGVMAVLNYAVKGMGGTGALTAQTAVYGTHWRDGFTSTTAGRIAILMNEATALTSSQVTLANGAAFTSAGGLYMPVIGHSVIFESPYFILGHTSFQNSALVMAGGTATNYTYEYAIDKNDGNGWSAMTSSSYTATQLGTALNGISGIDASLGFKLKIKITTGTTNATAITSVYVLTNSTTTAQDYQYPLDIITLTLTGLVTGSDIVVYAAGTTTVRQLKDQNSGTTFDYVYSTQESVDIGVFLAGYIPFYIRGYSLSATNASLPVAQVIDRAYLT